MVQTPMWAEELTAGRGWIALALVVFAAWRPWRLLLGAYLFGAVMTFELQAKAAGISIVAPEFLAALPYLATIVVLALISIAEVGRAGGAGLPRASLSEPTPETQQGDCQMTLITRRSLLRAGGAAAALPLLGGAGLRAGAAEGRLRLRRAGRRLRLHLRPRPGAAGGRGRASATRSQTTYVENVAEGPDSERVIRNLAEDGNQLIFTCSFGFMNPTIKVAKRFPDVKFEHCSGYQRADNVATYNARFYEGRAVCGTIAGAHVEDRDRRLHRLLPDPGGGDRGSTASRWRRGG